MSDAAAPQPQPKSDAINAPDAPAATATASAAAAVVPRVLSHRGERMAGIDPSTIKRHVFGAPKAASQAELRQLDLLHKRFVSQLGARLSTFLRMETSLRLAKSSIAPYAEFARGLAERSHLTLFGVEASRGNGAVELGIPLSLALADRMLGGKGRASTDRALTEIEVALLEDVVDVILGEWSQVWSERGESALAPRRIGHETGGQFLQIAAAGTPFVALEIEATLGETIERIQVGLPFSMIEPLLAKLQQTPAAAPVEESKPPQWRATFAEITVPVVAEWKVSEIPLSAVIAWRPGDIVPLSRELIAETRVRVSETQEFCGTAGFRNGSIAVQISQPLLKN